MTNLSCGWLAPDGILYKCRNYEHLPLAEELIRRFGYKRKGSYDDCLMDAGWVKITISSLGEKEWNIYWGDRFLTESQKNVLAPYFDDVIPMGFSSVCRWDQENERGM